MCNCGKCLRNDFVSFYPSAIEINYLNLNLNLEYITAIEAACTTLSQQDAEELRANINLVLRSPPKPNLTKSQNLAIRELKRDKDCIVLTADKGVAMVIMDRQDYISKANNLLSQNTYKTVLYFSFYNIKHIEKYYQYIKKKHVLT